MGISGKLWVKKWVKCGQMILKMVFLLLFSHYVLKMTKKTQEHRKNPKIAKKNKCFFPQKICKKSRKRRCLTATREYFKDSSKS